MLIDQDGEEQRFYSDLIAGKTVVINPFFAACTGSCPVMHRALAAVQNALGDRLGRDVFMLSVTVITTSGRWSRIVDRICRSAFRTRHGYRITTPSGQTISSASI